MDKFVMIGGASRTGTNTVSSFLHLHPGVIMFHGWGYSFIKVMNNNNNNVLESLKCVFPDGLQRCFQIEDSIFKNFTNHKNGGLVKEDLDKSPIVGIRWDFAEDGFVSRINDVTVYFIYCMRTDLKALFESMDLMGFLASGGNTLKGKIGHFEKMLCRSMDYIRGMKKEGFNIIPFDISDFGKVDYLRILEFIGLKISSLAESWAIDTPVTNIWNFDRPVVDMVVSQSLIDEYKEIKEVLAK